MKLKFGNSVYKKDLSNSIYQQRGSNFGLTVNGGMEINNRPDGVTGIRQAADIKKAQHQARKVNTIADGILLAEAKENIMGMDMD